MEQPDLYFYNLQRRAPKPRPVFNETYYSNLVQNAPQHYGPVFHGPIDREVGDNLVRRSGPGAYLVRESLRQARQYTLVMMFESEVKNYRLYFDGTQHYIADKLYSSLEELVADGLICSHCETYGRDQIQRMTMKRKKAEERPVLASQPLDEENRSGFERAVYVELGHSPRKSMAFVMDSESVFTASEPIKTKHDFKVTTFFGPNWCCACNNYMWGLVSQVSHFRYSLCCHL